MLLVPVLLGGVAAAASGRPDEALAKAIEDYTAPLDRAGLISGMLLVAHGDEVLFERAWGRADYELDAPITPETRFCVASVTKPMTVALTVKLIEQGKLDQNDPLEKWIPGFPEGRRITVSHLLNHRAGFPHRVTTDEQETVPHTAAEVAELAKQATLLFAPGERSEYSSSGYSVLARVCELAGGKTYAELLREQILAPAGMTRTGHADSRELLPGRAASYYLEPGGPVNAPLKDCSFLVGAGSVWSTARDLHRLQRALVRGDLGQSVQIATEAQSGFDWNGITNGFRTFADFHAADELHVIFTGNLHTGAADLLRQAAPRLARGEELPPAEVPSWSLAQVPDSVLAGCDGMYRSRPGQDLPLKASNGLSTCGDWILRPTSPTTFFSPQDFGQVTVFQDEQGLPQRLEWVGPGFSLTWPRVGPLPSR